MTVGLRPEVSVDSRTLSRTTERTYKISLWHDDVVDSALERGEVTRERDMREDWMTRTLR